jgi:hypothetical protein
MQLDPNKQFSSVYDRLGMYSKEAGRGSWKGRIIDDVSNIDKYDITVHLIDTTASDKYTVPHMDAR